MDKFMTSWLVAVFMSVAACIMQLALSMEILEMAPINFTLPIGKAILPCPDVLRNPTSDSSIVLSYGSKAILKCSSDGNSYPSRKYGFQDRSCCPVIYRPKPSDSGKYEITKDEHMKVLIKITYEINFLSPRATSVEPPTGHDGDEKGTAATTTTKAPTVNASVVEPPTGHDGDEKETAATTTTKAPTVNASVGVADMPFDSIDSRTDLAQPVERLSSDASERSDPNLEGLCTPNSIGPCTIINAFQTPENNVS